MRLIRRLRLPTPATAIACIALFVSLGGVSYGIATGSIDGREIKNGSVRGIDVKNRSLTGTDIAAERIGGGAIKEASLAAVPLAGGLNLAASVNAAGVAARLRGVVTVAPQGNGRYQVVFNRDVQGCFYSGTIANIGVSPNPPNGQVSVSTLPGNGSGVLVETTNAGGMRADRPFHLIVSC